MAEGTPAPDLMQQMLNGQIGGLKNGGGGNSGDMAPLPLHILSQFTPFDIVHDGHGIIQDVQNQQLSLQSGALSKFDTAGRNFLGIDFSDLFSRLSGEITDQTGGTGGDAGGGESGVSAPSDSGGGDDFQARIHSGNFDAGIQGVEISDGGFVGKPSDVPDMRGGGAGGGIDFS